MVSYTPFYSRERDINNLEGFGSQVVDSSYLKALGVSVEPDQAALEALKRGSGLLQRRLSEGTLIPRPRYEEVHGDPSKVKTEIHNYTGRCPTLTYEINPNTSARVYKELEREGLCETRRGLGTFVTQDEDRISSLRRELAENALNQFLSRMETLGFSRQEVIQMAEMGGRTFAGK